MDGNVILFVREKTKRTKKEVEQIKVVIQPEMMEIMRRWGNDNKGKDAYIFPHLQKGLSPVQLKKQVDLLGSLINNNMKSVAKEVGIKKPVRTYEARHSFATILKNSGAPVAMISQALGHSSMATTQAYLASFETDQLKEATFALTNFTKKAANR